jgi:hypothetical protein
LVAADQDAVIVLVSLEEVAELPPSLHSVTQLRKQELSTRALRRLWAEHGGAPKPSL